MTGQSRAWVVVRVGWTLGIVIAAGAASSGIPARADEPCVHGWSTVGPYEKPANWIWSLAVFDDGRGPALYAAGDFKRIGGVDANNVARWNGRVWEPLGEGTDGIAKSMTVFDDGSGPSLFVGGKFKHAGGQVVEYIARWDGQAWHALGKGVRLGGLDSGVLALCPHDDGQGLALWVGGDIRGAGGEEASCVARWDGETWHALPGEFHEFPVYEPAVGAFLPYDDGRGPALFVGGTFDGVGDIDSANIVRWDGSMWSAVGDGLPRGDRSWVSTVRVLRSFDVGGETRLLAGGGFERQYDLQMWDGSSWERVCRLNALGNDIVTTLLPSPFNGEPGLFVGGTFEVLTYGKGQEIRSDSIARWDGEKWYVLAPHDKQNPKWVSCLTEFDDGSGTAVYMGGGFGSIGGVLIRGLARYGCLKLGDLNCDGAVDFSDIDGFALALSDPTGYRTTYPSCDINHGDLNGDGKINFDDIDPFVQKLIGQ